MSLLTLQATFSFHQPPHGLFKEAEIGLIQAKITIFGDRLRGLVKRKNGLKCQERHMLNSLFQLKPWLWSKFEQNFEKRVFCLYFGRFPKMPISTMSSCKSGNDSCNGLWSFFASCRSNKKTQIVRLSISRKKVLPHHPTQNNLCDFV